jgi:MFS family permease
MLALARYTLKGPYQATAVVGMLAIVAVFIVPVMGYSAASVMLAFVTNLLAVVLVGLIILTQGSASGLKVIVVAALVLSLAAWLGLKSAEPGISMALLQWLPVIALAQVLRSSNSLALTLLAGVVIGILVIGFQYLFWTDLESNWIGQMVERQDGDAQLSQEQAQQLMQFVRLMMLLLASSLYLMYMLVIFIARWLQAKLADSEGFGQEFRALALGKPAALIAVVVIPLGLFLQLEWLISIAFLVIIAFMFQGIAVLHSRLAAKKQAYPLLVLFYVLLVFTWQITGILTAITGIVDNWLGFRKKPGNQSNVN